jgi:ATP-dependent helicase YprA (DUF1998 family)
MNSRHGTLIDEEAAPTLDVPALARELHLQLERYIEAQYPIRHASVVAERHALLESTKVISQEPFIESTPGYTPGPSYSELALSLSISTALEELAQDIPAIPPHLYKHQAEALEAFIGHDHDLVVVTGTGSGKTETFLLPILIRSLEEAHLRPQAFTMPAMRALILYPMNALVNDQLTRLRALFGNPRLASWFHRHYGTQRPVRFGMYTSRTPYPGLMSIDKNNKQLQPLLDYYLKLENEQHKQMEELKARGRWPELDLKGLQSAAQVGKIMVGEHDYELFTRHQMQLWCPDILITNYSMLEYMLMRPIERTLFQQTADWLKQDASNTLLIVLDEAHLYSGVTGAEIALLLRRLQARLGIDRNRVRYILTSASLDTGEAGQHSIIDFAATLVDVRANQNPGFAIIHGQRNEAPSSNSLTCTPEQEASALASFDLSAFTNRALDQVAGRAAIAELADKLGWLATLSYDDLPRYLGQKLPRLQAFRQLWNLTSGQAQAFEKIALRLFPTLDERTRGRATSALLALSSAARTEDDRPLLPVRAHMMFRGLPPVYACINPRCTARRVTADGPGVIGALWLSPRLHCTCGARVYELYAHRNCGALFLRAFAPDEPADFYWHEAGDLTRHDENDNKETLLLIGQPHPKATNLEPVYIHMMTGRVFSPNKHASKQAILDGDDELLRVFRPMQASSQRKGKQESFTDEGRPHWASCPVCRKGLQGRGITSLSTRGEQPFVNLTRRQFELQPPGITKPLDLDVVPNRGRKVLLFSDGRQRAARLARDLPREVELDTFRQALLLAVHQLSERTDQQLVKMDIALYREFVAVCSKNHLFFFDGDSQKLLLRHIHDFRESYESDTGLAEHEDWPPDIPQMYRLALLRQVADRFYSMQRMCAAVVEPAQISIRLKKKPLFARLQEDDLRAFLICWIEALLDESAFDASIASWDRQETVPGEGFKLASTSAKDSWNDAEKAAEALLGYARTELQQLRTILVDEFCEVKEGVAFLKPDKLAIRLTLDSTWHQCEDCAQLIWLPLRDTCPNPRCGSKRLVQLPSDDPALRARTDFYREPIRQVIANMHEPMHLTAEEHTAQLSHRDTQQISSTTEKYELRFQDIGLAPDRPAVDVLSCTTTMEVGVDIGSLLGIGLRTMPPRRANYQQRAGRAGRRSSALSTVLAYSENGSHDAHYFEHPDEMISGALPGPKISQVNERLLQRHVQAALIQTFFREYLDTSKPSARQYGYLSEALGAAHTFFDTSEAFGLSGFERWLNQMLSGTQPQLMQQVVAWLPDSIENKSLNASQKRDFVRAVASKFLGKLHRVGEDLYPQQINKGAADQQFDKSTDDLMLLDLLFDHGFLPTYAFPRDVRNFVIEEWNKDPKGNWRIGVRQRPDQSVDVALSEYVPGRELIVDKETYRVGGIYVDPFPGSTPANRVSSLFKREHYTFAFCGNCGYTQRMKTPYEATATRKCTLCQSQLTIQEILDPPGFAPLGAKRQEPGQHQHSTSTPGGTITQVNLVLPLTDADDFGHVTAGGRVAWSYAEHRELLIANSGKAGDGFSVCQSCGAAAPGNPPWLEQTHDRPFLVPSWMDTSRKCTAPGGIWHGYLGHIFHSDLLLLRFQWPNDVAYHVGHPWMQDAITTIAQAILLAATRLLDIATSELQVGWSYTIATREAGSGLSTPSRMVDFFVFDTLSGGAGYATQVGQHIDPLLSRTLEILTDCPEHCERSCYRCLRTYANRIKHSHLDRHLGGTLLQAILKGHAPSALSIKQQAAQLDMLRKYLELAGIDCEREDLLHGIQVPLRVKTSRGMKAVGSYPVQQEFPKASHPLNALPESQVQLFSDYELGHNLPKAAEALSS